MELYRQISLKKERISSKLTVSNNSLRRADYDGLEMLNVKMLQTGSSVV